MVLLKKVRLAALLLFLSSCYSSIEESIGEYDAKLVVDGSIEVGEYAYVALTQSVPYLESVDEDVLARASELNAKVTLSDGEQAEVLVLRRNESAYPLFIYRSSEIRGEIGKTYEIEIEFDDEVYHAITTIPEANSLDDLWFVRRENEPEKYFLEARLNDDPGQENYYRIFTRRLGKDDEYRPMYRSTLSDRLFDGLEVDISIFRGVENFDESRDDGFFLEGDTVEIKFSAIDREHYLFWLTAEEEVYSFSNPFASSGSEILHNVDNDALGVWGGYSSTYYRVIAH